MSMWHQPTIDVNVLIHGNLAEASSPAQAVGSNTFTNTNTDTAVIQGSWFSPGGSASDSSSVSAVGSHFFLHF